MGYESDEQIASRKNREREVKAAWRNWRKSKRERKILSSLPAANPQPKAIIVTRNRRVNRSQQDWKTWGTPGRRP